MPVEQVHDLIVVQAAADRAADDREGRLVALAFLDVRQDAGGGTLEAVAAGSAASAAPAARPARSSCLAGRPPRHPGSRRARADDPPRLGGEGDHLVLVTAGIAGSSGRMVRGEAPAIHS